MIKTASDLEVFNIAYKLAMDIFNLSRTFPKAETYSLTDQICRSSRSISANIAEGWGKRIYENEFNKHLIYSMGSLEETKLWLLFSKDCGYLSIENFETLNRKSDELGPKSINYMRAGNLFEMVVFGFPTSDFRLHTSGT